MKTSIYFWSYLVHFFLEWELFQTKVVEKINTSILWRKTFLFRLSCRLWDNVEKYSISVQATDDNMVPAHCMLDTKGYKHTLRICTNFPLLQSCKNAPQYCDYNILPFLLSVSMFGLQESRFVPWNLLHDGKTILSAFCFFPFLVSVSRGHKCWHISPIILIPLTAHICP